MTIIHHQKLRRLTRVRSKIKTNLSTPRLSVYRSNAHFWAQIIDDQHGQTLASASTKSLKLTSGSKMEKAQQVGQSIAALAKDKKITHVRFDRGLYRYHGQVKTFADAARTGGLKF